MQAAFCEEKVECRRVMLLAYFGERGFAAAACARTCDICSDTAGQAFEGARPRLHSALDIVLGIVHGSCGRPDAARRKKNLQAET